MAPLDHRRGAPRLAARKASNVRQVLLLLGRQGLPAPGPAGRDPRPTTGPRRTGPWPTHTPGQGARGGRPGEPSWGGPGNPAWRVPRGTRARDTPAQLTHCFWNTVRTAIHFKGIHIWGNTARTPIHLKGIHNWGINIRFGETPPPPPPPTPPASPSLAFPFSGIYK